MPIRVKTGLEEHFGEMWEGQITPTASASLPPPPDLEMFHQDCKDFTLDSHLDNKMRR